MYRAASVEEADSGSSMEPGKHALWTCPGAVVPLQGEKDLKSFGNVTVPRYQRANRQIHASGQH